ncbi:hypothetical protein PR202_gb03589 [Eleusine coracana subsp. coracana]|uniref:HMA domain-containing protein n=1 Tax=Eleusine coracana subsp. coracana TaxID=191504 RepID=A0AAV5E291_ELECO|nr:hypothetical protein PR202_gb03589 [Eleusine coracana subsp. coracana]
MAASVLFHKADKMKQRLQKSLAGVGSLSCSSAASTSVVAHHSSSHPRRRRLITSPSIPNNNNNNNSSSSTKPKKKTMISPASSSRFLLNSSRLQLMEQSDNNGDLTIMSPPSFIDLFPVSVTDHHKIAESSSILVLDDTAVANNKDDDDKQQQAVITRRSTSACSTRSQHQVVVLKVSLHCKGCAGKVKKHISKLQGVTSFDIDIATKKVTVMGDVTPLGVLNCISKVKNAQFWSSSPPRASASF